MRDLVLAFIAAFLFAVLPGRWAIERLRKLGAKQNISEDAPTAHSAKQGTPTMGGLLILAALVVSLFLYKVLFHPGESQTIGGVPANHTRALMLLMLIFGGIGFADDYLSARRGKNLGLRAREKFAAQCLVAIGFAFYLYATAQTGTTTYGADRAAVCG
jgi:phospho-N-acetylmuramoyl-pentapeptide-transferase